MFCAFKPHISVKSEDLTENESTTSDAIYELALAPPYTVDLLTRMPQPRTSYRAEIVNGKLFILGGTTTAYSEDVGCF